MENRPYQVLSPLSWLTNGFPHRVSDPMNILHDFAFLSASHAFRVQQCLSDCQFLAVLFINYHQELALLEIPRHAPNPRSHDIRAAHNVGNSTHIDNNRRKQIYRSTIYQNRNNVPIFTDGDGFPIRKNNFPAFDLLDLNPRPVR